MIMPFMRPFIKLKYAGTSRHFQDMSRTCPAQGGVSDYFLQYADTKKQQRENSHGYDIKRVLRGQKSQYKSRQQESP
jgi:hypothetical protein